MLVGRPWNLENRTKTLKGVNFHTLDMFFAGMISRLDLSTDFLQFLKIVESSWLSIWRRFGYEILVFISQEKKSEMMPKNAKQWKWGKPP